MINLVKNMRYNRRNIKNLNLVSCWSKSEMHSNVLVFVVKSHLPMTRLAFSITLRLFIPCLVRYFSPLLQIKTTCLAFFTSSLWFLDIFTLWKQCSDYSWLKTSQIFVQECRGQSSKRGGRCLNKLGFTEKKMKKGHKICIVTNVTIIVLLCLHPNIQTGLSKKRREQQKWFHMVKTQTQMNSTISSKKKNLNHLHHSLISPSSSSSSTPRMYKTLLHLWGKNIDSKTAFPAQTTCNY